MSKSKTQDPTHTTLNGEALIDDYVRSHSDAEPEYLYRLYRDTNVRLLHGRMASGHLQGRLLKMLVQMAHPKRVVEIGTFSGYSALCMAEGLDDGAHLYTFEINDEQEDFTRPWLENSEYADKISFIIGDALEKLPPLAAELACEDGVEDGEGVFDMAFVDGDKRTYTDTYRMLLPLMKRGSFIIADNTLWDGHVVEAEYDKDKQTIGIRAFNDMVAQDPAVEKVIIPLRDGLTIIRKK